MAINSKYEDDDGTKTASNDANDADSGNDGDAMASLMAAVVMAAKESASVTF